MRSARTRFHVAHVAHRRVILGLVVAWVAIASRSRRGWLSSPLQVRGVSSVGRARALQARGHRFDPDTLHSGLLGRSRNVADVSQYPAPLDQRRRTQHLANVTRENN